MQNSSNSIAECLNCLVEEWKNLFDVKPDIKLFFDVDRNGLLTLNDTILCPVSEVDPASVSYDAEELSLQTKTGALFFINISWPYGAENPEISSITKITRLFDNH